MNYPTLVAVPRLDKMMLATWYSQEVTGENGSPLLVTVPFGFLTDGASIPRLFWRVIGSPFSPKFSRAAVIHDYSYSRMRVSRSLADFWFREILMEDGVPRWKAWTMWAAVRAFGWARWAKK